MSNIVKKDFVIISDNGSMLYVEGQKVSEEVAKAFPHFMEGYKEPATPIHDPTLPRKLTKSQAEKMPEARLQAWVKQYYPRALPPGMTTKADLVDLVMDLQSE